MTTTTVVEYSSDGWTSEGSDRLKTCPVLARTLAGKPPCPRIAVFRITERNRHTVGTSYCCWECIPDDADDIPFYEAAGV